MFLDAAARWTDTGVLLTAAFTAAAVLVAWLAYRHGRARAGSHKPVIIRRPFKVPLVIDNRWWWAAINERDWHCYRVFDLHILNRSSIAQTVRMHGGSVLWPRLAAALPKLRIAVEEDFELAPNAAGNIELLVKSPSGTWPPEKDQEGEWRGQWYKRRYLVRLHGETSSGHPVNYFGWVRLRYFKGPETHKFESGTVRYGEPSRRKES